MQTQEKTLSDVMRDVWQARVWMMACGVVALVLACAFMMLAQPCYRAAMILAPASPMRAGADPYAPGPEGSLPAGYAREDDSPAFLRFEHTLRGPSVAKILLADDRLRAALGAERAYGFGPKKTDWSAEELSAYLQRRVRVEPVAGTALRRVSYAHPDRDFAAVLIAMMHDAADRLICEAARAETQERIDYLQGALERTANPDNRRVLTGLLMEQERLKMMVSMDQPCSAKAIEPPFSSARPAWPDPYLVLPLFVLCGLLAGFIVHGARRHEL